MKTMTDLRGTWHGWGLLSLGVALLVGVPPHPGFTDESPVTEGLESLDGALITPEQHARLSDIGLGSYPLESVSVNDVPLILGSLEHRDGGIRTLGCRALERTASKNFLNAKAAQRVATVLIPHLHGGDSEWVGWAVRGLEAVIRSNARDLDRGTYQQIDNIAIALLADDDANRRGRGADLLFHTLLFLDSQQVADAARALLSAAKRPTAETSLDPNAAPSASLRTLNAITCALAHCHDAPEDRLLEEVVWHLRQVYEDKRTCSGTKREIIMGMQRFAWRTQGEVRRKAIDLIIASISDGSLMYTHFSGVPSPVMHSGVEALVGVSRLLTAEQLVVAERVVLLLKESPGWLDKNIYDRLRQALELCRQNPHAGSQNRPKKARVLAPFVGSVRTPVHLKELSCALA